jgi:hypothetical protein
MKITMLLLNIVFLLASCSAPQAKNANEPTGSGKYIIPLGGNAFQTAADGQETITDRGIESWQQKETEFTVYFYAEEAKKVQLRLPLLQQTAKSKISVTVNETKFEVELGKGANEVDLGFHTLVQGYNSVSFYGVSKEGTNYAKIENLLVKYEGDLVLNYVKDNKDNNFHFGRRGPSVHINYQFPQNMKIKWFYNEIEVSEEDPIGSYYMANGFGEGYFGIQRNSETERKVLFSVWSPFQTDNPNEIPEADKIKLLKKGDKVKTGEFGHEGSGGQSYLIYNWKPLTTYKFLTSIEPDGKGNTVYTGYFMDSNVGKWLLIASFSRPKTSTYYTNPYSFLENFEPDYGHYTRAVIFQNQWACDVKGNWLPISKATFTGDINAENKVRLDYNGGVEENAFYLQNGGFFNATVPLNTPFEVAPPSKKPVIDFSRLP